MTDFFTRVAQAVASACSIDEAQALSFLETPPQPELGDAALPCFKLARTMRKAPPAIAAQLAEELSAQPFEGLKCVKAVGGYINFYADGAWLARQVLGHIVDTRDCLGQSDAGQGKTVCIDYSSINIAKRFHIGHLSTTLIGAALYRIYKRRGWQAVGINHLGDWGTQFGKMIAAFRRWGSREDVEARGIDALLELYVRFDREAQEDPVLAEEGRACFLAMEEGDEDALSIFNWFKELTLADAQRVYKRLGIVFDSYAGESFYTDKMGPVVEELKQKGLLVESQGAQVVDLSQWNMPPCIILKSDGATTYATRDITAALYRKNTYGFDRSLYVVAYQQNLHFKQVFKVLELMGYDWASTLEHVAFGMVSFEGQTLSTRKGRILYLDELLGRAVDKAAAIIEEKSPNLPDKAEVAEQIGIGAVCFFMLYNNRIKDIDFWWDRALNFEGETGPYVQYTHVRCASVLAKAGLTPGQALMHAPNGAHLTDADAQRVLTLLSGFDGILDEVLLRSEPSLLTRYLADLAQAYNSYYYNQRILDEDAAVRADRLQLTDAVRLTLSTGLGLLGIAAPNHM
nr:arginine--tRNA ligase [bacterium]